MNYLKFSTHQLESREKKHSIPTQYLIDRKLMDAGLTHQEIQMWAMNNKNILYQLMAEDDDPGFFLEDVEVSICSQINPLEVPRVERTYSRDSQEYPELIARLETCIGELSLPPLALSILASHPPSLALLVQNLEELERCFSVYVDALVPIHGQLLRVDLVYIGRKKGSPYDDLPDIYSMLRERADFSRTYEINVIPLHKEGK